MKKHWNPFVRFYQKIREIAFNSAYESLPTDIYAYTSPKVSKHIEKIIIRLEAAKIKNSNVIVAALQQLLRHYQDAVLSLADAYEDIPKIYRSGEDNEFVAAILERLEELNNQTMLRADELERSLDAEVYLRKENWLKTIANAGSYIENPDNKLALPDVLEDNYSDLNDYENTLIADIRTSIESVQDLIEPTATVNESSYTLRMIRDNYLPQSIKRYLDLSPMKRLQKLNGNKETAQSMFDEQLEHMKTSVEQAINQIETKSSSFLQHHRFVNERLKING